jgi:hypothetical protein
MPSSHELGPQGGALHIQNNSQQLSFLQVQPCQTYISSVMPFHSLKTWQKEQQQQAPAALASTADSSTAALH